MLSFVGLLYLSGLWKIVTMLQYWRLNKLFLIINNNGEFLYSAHTMLYALHTYYPWSLDLFIHAPFQLPFLEHTALAAISTLGTNRTHCHLCPTRYSLTPESSGAFEGRVFCPRTQHRNIVPILRGEKHDISLKILHHPGFETARQAVTLRHCATSLSHVCSPVWYCSTSNTFTTL